MLVTLKTGRVRRMLEVDLSTGEFTAVVHPPSLPMRGRRRRENTETRHLVTRSLATGQLHQTASSGHLPCSACTSYAEKENRRNGAKSWSAGTETPTSGSRVETRRFEHSRRNDIDSLTKKFQAATALLSVLVAISSAVASPHPYHSAMADVLDYGQPDAGPSSAMDYDETAEDYREQKSRFENERSTNNDYSMDTTADSGSPALDSPLRSSSPTTSRPRKSHRMYEFPKELAVEAALNRGPAALDDEKAIAGPQGESPCLVFL